MNNIFKLSLLVLTVMVKDCVSFEEQSMTVYEEPGYVDEVEKGIPAKAYNNGDMMGGNTWWTGTGAGGDISFVEKDGMYIYDVSNLGPKYKPLMGQTYPGLDFTGDIAIKVTARTEGDDFPVLALQMDDYEGYQTNATRPSHRIHAGDEFKDYYYVMDGKFVQSWPTDHNVNGELITKVMFFVNPGGAGYTGKIFIKNLEVVPADQVVETEEVKLAVGKDGGMIDDMEGNVSSWWTADGFKIEQVEDGNGNAIKLTATEVGPKYEAFGRGFPTMNFENAYKLRVRARIDGDVPPELRIDVKDPDGNTTNSRPATNRIMPGPPGEYRDYIFRFKDRFLQTYPDYKEVDGKRIVEFVMFINGGKAPWSGTLYIDEIESIFTGKVESEEEEKEVEEPVNKVIDDFSGNIYSWWTDENLEVTKDGKMLVVDAKGVGLEDESFGRAFQAIDFSKNPVLKITAKADKPAELRIDLKDLDNHVTNADPQSINVKSGEFKDYYIDFSGKFEQKSPSSAKVNPKEILEVIMYINKGGPLYSGKIFVKDIRAVSEMPEK